MLKKADGIITISILTVFTFLALFVFRALDDNRLTSWQWVFDGIDTVKIYLIFISGIIIAYLISRVSLPEWISISFILLLSFISGVVFWMEPEVIVDASRYFTQAKHLEFYGTGYFLMEWGGDINAWTDLPLIPFLYGLIFKFLGESRAYIQTFTTSLFTLTVLLVYLTGRTLWNRDVGYYGGLLLLGIPYLFTQIPLMLVDVPAMFFLTLTVFTFIKALSRGGVWVWLSSLAIFFAFLSKYSAWLMLSVLVVITAVYMFKYPDKHGEATGEFRGNQKSHPETTGYVFRFITITVVSCSLIALFFWYKFDLFSDQIRLLLSYQKPGLTRWGESFASTFLFQIHPFISILALYSIYAAIRKKDRRYLIISYLVILIFLLQIKRIRYTLMVFPMLALMASYGLCEIRSGESRRFLASCIVVSSLIVGTFLYLPFLQKLSAINLKHAGKFIESLDAERIEVFTLMQEDSVVNSAVSVPLLDLVTEKRIIYHYKPDGSPPEEDVLTSPLRFTWEYKNPEYYITDNSGSKNAVVVISGFSGQTIPNEIIEKTKTYAHFRAFETSKDIFKYRTIVTVYYD